MTSRKSLKKSQPADEHGDPHAGAESIASIHEAICDSILDIAPDITRVELEASTDLQIDLGLDSIDLVNIAGAITERTGVQIPDADYARLRRIGQIAEFVAERINGSA